MNKLFFLIQILFISFSFQSCEMFEAHPYDANVKGAKNLNEKHIIQIEKNLKGKKAVLVVGGGSMKRFGFLDKAVGYLEEGGMEVKLFENVV